MPPFVYVSQSEAETARLGKRLAETLPPSAVIALNGPLGAGKTRLVQAVAAHVGIPSEEVTSPTFVLIHEYQGQRPIYHFDAYRLRDDDEFLELGPEEYFQREGWCFIEWADRVEACLPPERLEICIEHGGPEQRSFTFAARGPLYEATIAQLAAAAGEHQGEDAEEST